MRLLLDTAVLLWVSYDAARLSPAARLAYTDPANDRYVSVASIWEVIVKHRAGKLPGLVSLDEFVEPLKRSGAIRILPLSESAVLRLRDLPDIHRDPFDRMLVCQALDEGLTLVTPDGTTRKVPRAHAVVVDSWHSARATTRAGRVLRQP